MASSRIPDSIVRDAVLEFLGRRGKTIFEIGGNRNLTHDGDAAQQAYSKDHVWHTMRDLNEFVKLRFSINSLDYKSRTSYQKIVTIISLLRKDGTILDWNPNKHYGIWRLARGMRVPNDFLVVVDKMGRERLRQLKAGYREGRLAALGVTRGVRGAWAVNPKLHGDVWKSMGKGDRLFFAEAGSDFTHCGTVHSTVRDRSIAVGLWGEDARTRSHDMLVLLSKVDEVSIPLYDAFRTAGISVPAAGGVFPSSKPIMLAVRRLAGDLDPPGVVTLSDDGAGPAKKKNEAVTRRIRDTPKVRNLKKKYGNRCQACQHRIELPGGRGYSEVHHLHPLGEDGDDDYGNMLVVCPNHHVEFDYCVIGISEDGVTLVGRDGQRVGRLTILDGHRLKMKNIRHHLRRMEAYGA